MKYSEFTTQKSTCLCLTQRNFIISSDFICQSLEQSPLISTITDFWLYAQIKKADMKNCTEKWFTYCSNLHACGGLCCYVCQHINRWMVMVSHNLDSKIGMSINIYEYLMRSDSPTDFHFCHPCVYLQYYYCTASIPTHITCVGIYTAVNTPFNAYVYLYWLDQTKTETKYHATPNTNKGQQLQYTCTVLAAIKVFDIVNRSLARGNFPKSGSAQLHVIRWQLKTLPLLLCFSFLVAAYSHTAFYSAIRFDKDQTSYIHMMHCDSNTYTGYMYNTLQLLEFQRTHTLCALSMHFNSEYCTVPRLVAGTLQQMMQWIWNSIAYMHNIEAVVAQDTETLAEAHNIIVTRQVFYQAGHCS